MSKTKAISTKTQKKVRAESRTFTERVCTTARSLYQRFLAFSKEKYFYYLAFAIPVVILYITYIFMEVYPYGDKSILSLDMDGQYIYFFHQLRDVYTGQASLFYTFERCLGGEFLGYFTYYLASPVSFLVVLFPLSMLVDAVKFIIIIKCGLAGLTFAIYLARARKKNVYGFIIFPVMYALCSYATMFQFNPMWMDAMIWLPLITLGIESLVTNGRFKLFIISLALAICSNYYIGYMLCIYVAVYFFAFLFSKSDDEINGLKESYHKLKSLARIAIASVIALMIACAIIFSAYYSLSFGKTSYQDNDMEAQVKFDLLHLVAKMFLGSFDTLRPQGTPNVYAGLLTLMLLPAFYFCKKISIREKITFSALVSAFVLSFTITTYDLMWHGFQAPVWFNHRYSFLLSFILLTMAYKAFEHVDNIQPATFGKITLALLLLLAIVQKTVTLSRYEYVETDWKEIPTTPDLSMVYLSALFIGLYLLVFVVKHNRPVLKTLMSVFLVFLVCFEATFNTLINTDGAMKDGGVANHDNYMDYVEPLAAIADEIAASDPSFYRMEHLRYRKKNDNFAANMNGLTEFTSTFNASIVNLMKKFGFDINNPAIKYVSSNPIVDSIFGVKYVVAPNSGNDTNGKLPGFYSIYDGYELYYSDDTYDVFKNPYALPIAYLVDQSFERAFEKSDFFDGGISFSKTSNNMLSAMLGQEVNLFSICEYTTNQGNLSKISVDANGGKTFRKNDSDSNAAYFSFTVQAQTDGNIYMYLPSPYTTAAKLYIDGKQIYSTFFQGDQKGIVDLGYYETGEVVTVKLEFTHWRIYLWDTQDYFFQMDTDAFESVFGTLKNGGFNITEHSDTFLSGTLNASKDGAVFTTIPYDSNWKVYVDGERVETYEMLDSMLGFNIGKGEHTVEMRYVHTPFIIGAVISSFGIAVLVLLWIFEKKVREKFMKPCPIILERIAREQAELAKAETAEIELESTSTAETTDNNQNDTVSSDTDDVEAPVTVYEDDDPSPVIVVNNVEENKANNSKSNNYKKNYPQNNKSKKKAKK